MQTTTKVALLSLLALGDARQNLRHRGRNVNNEIPSRVVQARNLDEIVEEFSGLNTDTPAVVVSVPSVEDEPAVIVVEQEVEMAEKMDEKMDEEMDEEKDEEMDEEMVPVETLESSGLDQSGVQVVANVTGISGVIVDEIEAAVTEVEAEPVDKNDKDNEKDAEKDNEEDRDIFEDEVSEIEPAMEEEEAEPVDKNDKDNEKDAGEDRDGFEEEIAEIEPAMEEKNEEKGEKEGKDNDRK